jgi:hypothetical protein
MVMVVTTSLSVQSHFVGPVAQPLLPIDKL